MNRYPLWKYLIVIVALVLGVIYALPNAFGEDPALQIATTAGEAPAETTQQRIVDLLTDAGIEVEEVELREELFLVRLTSQEAQLRGADLLKQALGREHIVALNLAPDTPDWLRGLNAEPMYLGLDLRGGVHFLMEVDLPTAVTQALERYTGEFRGLLRENRVRYEQVTLADRTIAVGFGEAAERERAYAVLDRQYPELEFEQDERAGRFWLQAALSEARLQEIREFAVQQNITTLRNRVNELGVAEPIIQRQGLDRIVVQLPGVQDTAQAKDILGATATLEFRFVDESQFPYTGGPDDRVPPGSEVLPRREGGYVLLERDVILTGDYITDASSTIDQQTGQSQVNIDLSAAGGDIMRRATRDSIGRFMAVVFIENTVETRRTAEGELERVRLRTEEVINTARIQDVLGSSFRITGLENPREATNLALLLRAGALAAPVEIVEERTIGPSLGAQNIEQGTNAVIIGFLAVIIFMAIYYKVFGLVADLALLMNLVLMVAVLSLLQATLTLPGIAGIVLTLGMAVDANVLIFQRIREELAGGAGPQVAIRAGFDKAFSTIADANITTLIAAVVLFAFGTGPVKGFAVTLSIGLVTSMFTAIMMSRAVINLIYGGRRVSRLHI